MAISPAGEVSEEAFAEAVDTLESNAAEHLPLAGKWASLAALPVKCTRNNCPARPDTVKALIKGAVKKRNSVVVIVAPKEHFLALAAAVIAVGAASFDEYLVDARAHEDDTSGVDQLLDLCDGR